MKKYTSYSFVLCLVLLSNILSAEGKKADDSLKTYIIPGITVSSTRAVLRESPVPFSEISGQEIKNSYTTQDVPVLLSQLPSVTFFSQNGNGIGYNILTMRGIDQRRISVMINGIPQNDPEDHIVYWIDFPDLMSSLDNIQVQRGTGMAAYGPAAFGGSINLMTSNFLAQKGVKIYSGFGMQQYESDGKTILQGNVSKLSVEAASGLTGNYSFYGRFSRINSMGYRDRSWAELNSYFLSAARFDDFLTTQINIFGGPFSDGLAYTGLPKSYISDPELRRYNPVYGGWSYDTTGRNVISFYSRRAQEQENFSQPHYEILNNLKISENIGIRSALFYYTGEGSFDMDGSWIDAGMYQLNRENGYDSAATPVNSLYKAYVGNKQGGWIPSLSWKHGQNEFTAGFELRFHRSEHWGKIIYAENLPSNYNPEFKFYYNRGARDIYSIFAREKLYLNDALVLTGEAQLSSQNYSIYYEKAGRYYTSYITTNGDTITNGKDLFNINYLFFNPRFGINYLLNDKINIFALAAFTSHEPRMRNLYAADDAFWGAKPLFEGDTLADGTRRYDFSKPLIKPEKMLNFELGMNWKSDDYALNGNFYLMEFYDELVKSGRLDIVGNPIDGNAPRTVHYGFELEGRAGLLNGKFGKLYLTSNFTISRNEILEYDFITYNKDVVSLSGNEIAGFPSLMFSLRLSYESGGLYLSLFGKYTGESRTDNFGDLITSDDRIKNHFLNDPYNVYYADNKLDAYKYINADLAYSFRDLPFFSNIRIHLQINNIMNERYAAGAEGREFFPAAERNMFMSIELRF